MQPLKFSPVPISLPKLGRLSFLKYSSIRFSRDAFCTSNVFLFSRPTGHCPAGMSNLRTESSRQPPSRQGAVYARSSSSSDQPLCPLATYVVELEQALTKLRIAGKNQKLSLSNACRTWTHIRKFERLLTQSDPVRRQLNNVVPGDQSESSQRLSQKAYVLRVHMRDALNAFESDKAQLGISN